MPRGTRRRPEPTTPTITSDIPSTPPRLPPGTSPPPPPKLPKKPRQPTRRALEIRDAAALKEERRLVRNEEDRKEKARQAALSAHRPHTETGQKLRQEHSREMNNVVAVGERVRAIQAKEKEGWEAEVAQFGEPEARRRREEVREFMRKEDMLVTSDIEDMEWEEKQANPEIVISAHVRVNKTLIIQDNWVKKTLEDFDVSDYECHLLSKMTKKDYDEWVREKGTVHIRARHTRATFTSQSFSEFSIEEWGIITNIVRDQASRWPGTVIDVKFELSYTAPKIKKKRPVEVLSSDTAEPRPQPKKTRTEKLLEKQEARDDAMSSA